MMRSSAQTLVLTASAALAALALAAGPAHGTSLQTQAGQPYAGVLNTALVVPPGVHVDTDQGDIDCNQSPITAAITNAGSTGGPAMGNISALDFTNNPGGNACPDTIAIANHLNFTAQTLPWTANFDWLSDNTGGTRNGTVTFSGVTFTASFDTAATSCTYRADFNNTGGTTNQLEADFFNPNNTASGNTEMRLVTEPFEFASGDGGCSAVPTSQLSATYNLTGAGAAKLQLRGPPAPPATNPPASTPAAGGVAAKAKKCKKAKKRAAAAKKKCKRKKR